MSEPEVTTADPTERLPSGIGAPGVRSGRAFTRTEIAAARRLGLVSGRESTDTLGGPLYWATGDYIPNDVRQDHEDCTVVLAAIAREWPNVIGAKADALNIPTEEPTT